MREVVVPFHDNPVLVIGSEVDTATKFTLNFSTDPVNDIRSVCVGSATGRRCV